jgi:hypothetical protein
MSQNQKTRSKLLIGAVMKAAAAATSPTVPAGKTAAIAGLAGFVLRLFRSRENRPGIAGLPAPQPSFPKRGRGRPARMQQGSSKGDRRMTATPAGAPRPSSESATNLTGKGGVNHG